MFRFALRLLYKPKKSLKIHCFGQDYDHPFGLAAGMDKKAEALRGWESSGLAVSEIGGVTMHEPGVSRIVTVDIEEGAKLAAM